MTVRQHLFYYIGTYYRILGIHALVVSSPSLGYHIILLFRMKKIKNPTKFNVIIYCSRIVKDCFFYASCSFSVFHYRNGPFYFIVIVAAAITAVSGRRTRTLLVSALIAMFGSPPILRDRTEDHVGIHILIYIYMYFITYK